MNYLLAAGHCFASPTFEAKFVRAIYWFARLVAVVVIGFAETELVVGEIVWAVYWSTLLVAIVIGFAESEFVAEFVAVSEIEAVSVSEAVSAVGEIG